MSCKVITVVVVNDNGSRTRIAVDLDWEKFKRFSSKKAFPNFARPKVFEVVIQRDQDGWAGCDRIAAARITTWIAMNNVHDPKPLTTEALKIKDILDIVHVYRAAHAFYLRRDLRGDDVRNKIWQYIHAGHLSCDDLCMIMELVPFDGGLTKSAQHCIMLSRVKGGRFVNPDMAAIEEYAKNAGWWEHMLRIEQEIMDKAKTRNQAKHNQAWPALR